MRFSSAAILVLVLATAAAQRPGGGISRGGMRPGPPVSLERQPVHASEWELSPGFGSGLSDRGGARSRGRGGDPIPVGTSPLGNSLFFALPTPIVPYPGYPPDTPYYPQPPPDEGPAFPPADVTQVPTTVSPSLTNPDTHFNAVGSEPAREPGEMATAGSSGLTYVLIPWAAAFRQR